MEKHPILNRLANSELHRPVEVVFLNDILHFEASARYPATIRYIDESEFYLVIPPVKASEKPPNNNTLKGVEVRLLPMDARCTTKSSIYHAGFGHLLVFENQGKLHQRRFLRVPFDEQVSVSILDEGRRAAKELKAQTIDLSASGLTIRCNAGSGLTYGTSCQLRIHRPDFPAFDADCGAALLNGKVVRTCADTKRPGCDNFGIQFIYDDIAKEYAKTDRLDDLCWRMAFPTSQGHQDFERAMSLTASLNANRDIDTVLFKMTLSAADVVSAEASSILLFDETHPDKSYLLFRTTSDRKTRKAVDKSSILTQTRVSDGVAWWVAQTGEPAIVNDVEKEARFTGSIDRRTDFKTKSLLAVPIFWEKEVIGVLEAVNKTEGASFTQFDLQMLLLLANQIGSVIKNGQMREKYENFFTNSIELTVKAIESVGVLVGMMSLGHCWRVAALATTMGSHFGIRGQAFDDLYYGAALHDIGLLEAENQQPFQFSPVGSVTRNSTDRVVKLHPVAGENLVKGIQMWHGAAPIIRHHHERFDGGGFPDGLAGEAIPQAARIVSVIEAYEESIHWLRFQHQTEAEVCQHAIELIHKEAGTHFDPEVVDVFVNECVQFFAS